MMSLAVAAAMFALASCSCCNNCKKAAEEPAAVEACTECEGKCCEQKCDETKCADCEKKAECEKECCKGCDSTAVKECCKAE